VGRRPGVVLFVARTMSEDIAQTEKLVTPL